MFLTSMEIAKEAKKEIDLDTLQSLCGQCGFYKECRTPKMKVTGASTNHCGDGHRAGCHLSFPA